MDQGLSIFADNGNDKKKKTTPKTKKITKSQMQAAFSYAFSKNHKKEFQNFKKKSNKPDKPINLHEDFWKGSEEILKMVLHCSKAEPIKAYLIKSTPGIGKTEAALQAAALCAKLGGKVIYAAPTKNQVFQFYDRFKGTLQGQGIYVIVLQGRHPGYLREMILEDGSIVEIKEPPNCIKYDDVVRSGKRGVSPQRGVCVKCHLRPGFRSQAGAITGWKDSCLYYQARGKASGFVPVGNHTPIIATTHHSAACLVTDGEMIVPDLLLMDEDFTQAMRDIVEWNEDELQRVVDVPALAKFRRLIKQAIRVSKRMLGLSKRKSSKEYKKLSEEEKVLCQVMSDASVDHHTVILSGINLVLILRRAAYEIGEDLDDVLEKAALSDIGVEGGGFVGMSEEKFNRVPHQKEPTVAFDLQAVVRDAKQAKETAYKISIRKSPDSLWGLHLDHIRRVNYGGKMVILDAYGDKGIYERICGREVEVSEVKCKCRSNVSVFHYSENTSRKMMDNIEYRLRLYYEFVVPVLKKHNGKKVLIYTQKRYVKWLREVIERSGFEFEALAIKWYWMDRGDNNYGDFDAEILYGTSYSNLTGDRHLVNSLHAGEELIDFSELKNGEYADPRVAAIKKSRQENEMLQAFYRLRPSKPREDPQEIHIISKMKLPLDYEMYGATIKTNHRPDFDNEGMLIAIQRMYDYFGFYTNLMAPFVYEVNLLIDWWESGASLSKKRLNMEYDELKNRLKIFNHYFFHRQIVKGLLEKGLDIVPKSIKFGTGAATVWGDEKKALVFLEHLKAEFREPGCDDEPGVSGASIEDIYDAIYDADAITPVVPISTVDIECQQPATDEQQVAEETKHHGNEAALQMLEQMKQSSMLSEKEFNEKYASSYEALGLDLSGTDTS